MAFPAQVATLKTDFRVARRRPVNFSAFIRETRAEVSQVAVSDLSCHGCRFESSTKFEVATVVWLKIAGVSPRRVRIVWQDGCVFGCEFDCPLGEEVVDDLCKIQERDRRALDPKRGAGFGRAP